MKYNKLKLAALIGLTSLTGLTAACAKGHDHKHDDDHKHDHEEGSHAGHGHEDHDDHGHGEHEEHDHHQKQAGPNGGRVITEVEPHLEFYVTKEGKVQISFLNDAGEVIPPANQKVSLIGGDRSSPIRLKFEQRGNVLLSNQTLPSKNNLPIVLQVKVTPNSETIREKFNLNLSECPTCDFKEYACICEHGEEDHSGHDH
jgi:hypothetical protein